MPPELDAQLAATLTPEELEAINGEDSPEEKLIMRAEPEVDDDDSDDDADDGDAAEAPPVEGVPADEEPADSPEDEPASPAKDAAEPRYESKLPTDYDDQIKALKDRDAELRQKYKDGEIDIDERDDGLSALAEQREGLLVARAKAEISQEMSQQSAQQQWQRTIGTFMFDAAKGEGAIDYRKDEAKAADLDQFVKVLANRAENSDKPMEWFLQEAHKRVQALHGVRPTPVADAKKTVADAVAKRKPPVGSAPKTLAQVPGGDGPGDVSGEFADIEALDGLDLEDAIRKMTPAQREKFARS